MANPGFPRHGRRPQTRVPTYYLPSFHRKLHETKAINLDRDRGAGGDGGGGGVRNTTYTWVSWVANFFFPRSILSGGIGPFIYQIESNQFRETRMSVFMFKSGPDCWLRLSLLTAIEGGAMRGAVAETPENHPRPPGGCHREVSHWNNTSYRGSLQFVLVMIRI